MVGRSVEVGKTTRHKNELKPTTAIIKQRKKLNQQTKIEQPKKRVDLTNLKDGISQVRTMMQVDQSKSYMIAQSSSYSNRQNLKWRQINKNSDIAMRSRRNSRELKWLIY